MVAAILLAGASGSRMNSALPKQYLHLQNKPLILYPFETLLAEKEIDELVIVCEPSYQTLFQTHKKRLHFALPGAERQDSVYSGMQTLSSSTHWVCIHDGARPLLSSSDLHAVILAGKQYAAATLAVKAKVKMKESDESGFVKKTIDRSKLWEIQTPQVLSYPLLKEGFQKVFQQNIQVTDDVSLAELLGHPVKLVAGSYSNIKITTPEDLAIADVLMRNLRAKVQTDTSL